MRHAPVDVEPKAEIVEGFAANGVQNGSCEKTLRVYMIVGRDVQQ